MERLHRRDAYYVVNLPFATKMEKFKEALSLSTGYNDRLYFEIQEWVEDMMPLGDRKLPPLLTLSEYVKDTRPSPVVQHTIGALRPQLLLDVPHASSTPRLNRNVYVALDGPGGYVISPSVAYPNLFVGTKESRPGWDFVWHLRVYDEEPQGGVSVWSKLMLDNKRWRAIIFLDTGKIINRFKTAHDVKDTRPATKTRELRRLGLSLSQHKLSLPKFLALIPEEQDMINTLVTQNPEQVYVSPKVQESLCLPSDVVLTFPQPLAVQSENILAERYDKMVGKTLMYMDVEDLRGNPQGYLYADQDVKGKVVKESSIIPGKALLGYVGEPPADLPPLRMRLEKKGDYLYIYKRCTGTFPVQFSRYDYRDLHKQGVSLRMYLVSDEAVGRVVL